MVGSDLANQGSMPLRHHSLVAWQRADDLFIEVHKLSLSSFPDFERYELGSQIRRAAYSVAANIVEGCEREHKNQFTIHNVSDDTSFTNRRLPDMTGSAHVGPSATV
jgi:23S rRNA-intervening sequence protein